MRNSSIGGGDQSLCFRDLRALPPSLGAGGW
jgi:hypothetical protein